MTKKLIIFGAGQIAELAHYYFTHDSAYDVVAFCIDEDYKTQETFCSLPIVSFEEVQKHYPPQEYECFIALAYAHLNGVREEKYKQAKIKGYKMASYVSSKATILNDDIGDNAFILEDNTVQPFVKISNNVTLWSGNHIGHRRQCFYLFSCGG
jgi:FlaA1/EpsC-like NDP-sugar epimerase